MNYPLDNVRTVHWVVKGLAVPFEVAADRDRASKAHACTCGREWWFGGWDCIVCGGFPKYVKAVTA